MFVCVCVCLHNAHRVGHNEVIGVCRTGPDAEGLGRYHWNEMLAYPRKPITHWHALGEVEDCSFFSLKVRGGTSQLQDFPELPQCFAASLRFSEKADKARGLAANHRAWGNNPVNFNRDV